MPSRQTLYWERAPAACRPLAPAESASGRMGNAWLPFLASSSPAAAAEKPRACEAACVSETNSDAQPDVSSDDMQSSIALASRGPRSSAPLRPPPSFMHGALRACGPTCTWPARGRVAVPATCPSKALYQANSSSLSLFPTRVVFPSSPRPSEVPSWALGALSTCTLAHAPRTRGTGHSEQRQEDLAFRRSEPLRPSVCKVCAVTVIL